MSSTSGEERKVTPRSAEEGPSESGAGQERKVSRRDFLGIALAAAVVLLVAGVAAVASSLVNPGFVPQETVTTTRTGSSVTTSASGFPRVKVANLSDLQVGKWVTFNYPLEETPNLLAKLGQKAEGGVGPDGDIVAYSQICQHLGCVVGYVSTGASPSCDSSYVASAPVGYCCCHGSAYDLTKGAAVLSGPSPRPVPQVILEVDSSTGDIYATGMTPPTIFGHDTGSSDVTQDLKGGTLVSG